MAFWLHWYSYFVVQNNSFVSARHVVWTLSKSTTKIAIRNFCASNCTRGNSLKFYQIGRNIVKSDEVTAIEICTVGEHALHSNESPIKGPHYLFSTEMPFENSTITDVLPSQLHNVYTHTHTQRISSSLQCGDSHPLQLSSFG
jgi:hypothetical protein